MQLLPIYPEWATQVQVTWEEAMAATPEFWSQLVLDRNLIVIQGLGNQLADAEFYQLGQKFGRVWDQTDYKKPVVSNGFDPTLADRTGATPVSYFKSNNNHFGAGYMDYHADMVHIGANSYPGRLLYMVNNTTDGSGQTAWLNLELGWSLLTDEEQAQYSDCWIWMHDMYIPETRVERLPLLKTNPKTGRVSPTLNCNYMGPHTRAWINHVERNGQQLSWADSTQFITELYQLLESRANTVYWHNWTQGDIIVYDNWFNVHKRLAVVDASTADGQGRLLKRLTFNFR